MKFKKIMSLALALIMATALCVPALAANPGSSSSADSSSTSQSTSMTGNTEVGKIDLVVYSPTGLVFNPSKIYVKVLTASGTIAGSSAAAADYKEVNDQIIVPTVQIQNKTNVPLNMTATVGIQLGAGASGVTVATAAPNDNQTAKQVMVSAEFAVTDANIYASTPETIPDEAWISNSKLIAAAATAFDAANNKITGGKAHTAAQAVKIPATEAGTGGQTPNYVYVKFSGAATKAPTTPWGDNDTFNLYTVYQFQPQATPEKRMLVLTKTGTGFPAFTSSDNGKPTFTIAYTKTALTDLDKQTSTLSTNIFKGTDGEYFTSSVCKVWPNYTVTVKPLEATDSSGAGTGKYYTISDVKFYNEDSTANSAVRATKVGTGSGAYYTFTMPDANLHIAVTVAAQAS